MRQLREQFNPVIRSTPFNKGYPRQQDHKQKGSKVYLRCPDWMIRLS